jgi:hypothetical protein
MKNSIIFTAMAALMGMIFIAATFGSMSTDGSPAGYSGSPADGQDCSSCHKVKAKTAENLIKINADNNVYTPGKTYTVTVNLKGTIKSKKFGFQVSPQNNSGRLLGKLIVTNALETGLAGNGKCINQKAKGVDGNGSRTWTFDWTAPAKGTGDVTFYGSFLIGGSPEIVNNSTLTIKELTK